MIKLHKGGKCLAWLPWLVAHGNEYLFSMVKLECRQYKGGGDSQKALRLKLQINLSYSNSTFGKIKTPFLSSKMH